ncbi:MAG: DMT family transporter [Planctomycetota bacterium]|jgi:drug/metabolite transporter (DMT)-like permease
MRSAFYASLAIVPFVAFNLLLRSLIFREGCREGWPPGLVGTLSRVVTLPVLAAWILSTGGGWRRLRPRGVLGWLLLMGCVSAVVHVLWLASLKWTTATNVAMLFRLDLVFVVLIGTMLGLERVGTAQLVLVPVMFIGLALVSEVHEFDFAGHLTGDLMVVVAAFGFAVNAFVIRRILRTMDEEAVALYNHAMSMLGFVGLAVVAGDFARAGEVFADPVAWQTIAVLGVVAAAGLPLYYTALRRMDVWKLRTFMLAAPVITAAVEWPLWGVRLSAYQGLGAAVILGGLAVLIRIEARAEPSPPA